MPDIHIQRDHRLGLPAARALAIQWAEQAQRKFDMECSYAACENPAAEHGAQDELSFKRAGVSGSLVVTANSFVLDAKLGFLFGTFKDRIEAEIAKNLDGLLGAKSA